MNQLYMVRMGIVIPTVQNAEHGDVFNNAHGHHEDVHRKRIDLSPILLIFGMWFPHHKTILNTIDGTRSASLFRWVDIDVRVFS